MKRFEYLDNAKGIGILLIMLGHTSGLPDILYQIVFSFHVPLFFFISGFLMSEKLEQESLFDIITKITQRIFVPLVFYFMISYSLWILRVTFEIGISQKPESILIPLYQFFLGDVKFAVVNSTLWYFLCMYNIVLLYSLAKKIFRNDYFILLISSLIIIFINVTNLFSSEVRSPYNFDVAFMALPFFCLGVIDRKYFDLSFTKLSIYKAFIIFIAFLFLSLSNGKVDINKFNFGCNIFLFYFNSFLGIYITLFLSKKINFSYVKKILNWISFNSIFIFPIHIVIYSLITGAIFYSLGVDIKEYSGFILSIAYIILTLSIVFGFISILPKRIYFFMGR